MEVDLRYPIGKFQAKELYTEQEIQESIKRIESLPGNLEKVVSNLSDAQLDTPYREGGWTVRKVVHHVADSHTNAYIRVKWTLTESTPRIKAYDEKMWATTPETNASPELSLLLLSALHRKWVVLLRGIPFPDFGRQFQHPETNKFIRLDQLCTMYAWHGEHHLAHITSLIQRFNW